MKKRDYITVILIILLFSISCKKEKIENEEPEPEPYVFITSKNIISNIYPTNNSSISIFDAPRVNFSLEINTVFKNYYNVSYRAILDSLYLEDKNQNKIAGNFVFSEDKKSVAFVPDVFFNITESNHFCIYTHYEYLKEGVWYTYNSDILKNNYNVYFSTDLNKPPTEDIFFSIIPENNSDNISIYNKNITIVCKFPIDSTIQMYYSNIQHKLKLADFEVLSDNNDLNGNIQVSDKNISFTPIDTFPSNKTINYKLKLYWEYNFDNQWHPFFQDNDTLLTELTGSFSTENYVHTGVIDSENIEYTYPIDRQYHFLKNESSTGYLKLKFEQDDIFESKSWNFIARYTSPGLETIEKNIDYNGENLLFSFPIPGQLENETIYKLEFIQQFKKTKEENSFYELYFRTSMYNSFEDKWSSYSTGYGGFAGNSFHILNLSYYGDEYFDKFECSILTQMEAKTDNYWYQNYILPIYDGLSTSGLFLNRDTEPYGIPPLNSFSKYTGVDDIYLSDEQILNNNAPRVNAHTGYINYIMDFFIEKDYIDLRSQIEDIPDEQRTEWMLNNFNASHHHGILSGYPDYIDYNASLKYMVTPYISSFEIIIPFKH